MKIKTHSRKIRNLLTSFGALATALVFSSGLLAQSKDQVLSSILKKNETYKTVISSCTQVKTMKGMKKNVVSEGNMYFVREKNQMKMQFAGHKNSGKEKDSQLILNGDKVVIINGGTKNVFNTKTDHNMKLLEQTLLYCIKGQVAEAAKANGSSVNLKITDQYYVFDFDVARNTKGRWNHLEASYSKKDMSLCILKLEEKNGNSTTYNTLKKEFNGVVTPDVFNY